MNKLAVILGCLLLCLGTGQAFAFQNNPNYINGNFNYGTWNSSGDIRIVGPTRCVMSTDGPNRSTGNTTLYTVTASMTTGDGQFQLTRNGGGSTIPFSLEYEWFDDVSSTSEFLGYNTPSAPHMGGKRIGGINCNIGGVRVRNGRMTLHINEADLSAAFNGDYQGRLTVVHTGGIGMSQVRTRTNLRIRLTKDSTEIQLRNLDTVDLGTWDLAASSIADTEAYCVYSSTGSYRITAASTTQGSGGPASFAIENSSDPGNRIDFDLYVDDDSNAQTGGVQIDNGETIGGMTGTLNRSCTGNNASIYAVTTGDLGASRAGAYTAMVTLTVEPE